MHEPLNIILLEEIDPVMGHIGGEYRGNLLCIGGYESRDGKYIYRKPSLLYIKPYSFAQVGDIGADIWVEYEMRGDVPLPTSGACGVIHQDYLYQFGGTHEDNPIYPTAINTTNRLYRLDLREGIWEFLSPRRSTERQPSPLTFSVGFGHEKGVYFFGGYGPRIKMFHGQQAFLTDPTASIVVESKGKHSYCWNNQLTMFDIATKKWSIVKQGGDVPEPRCGGASAHDTERNLLFIAGGRCKDVKYNDLYMLDIGSFVWTKFVLNLPPHVAGMQWPNLTQCLIDDYFMLCVYYEDPNAEGFAPCYERLKLTIDVDTKKATATTFEHPTKPNCWALHAFVKDAFIEYGGFTRGLDQSMTCSNECVEIKVPAKPRPKSPTPEPVPKVEGEEEQPEEEKPDDVRFELWSRRLRTFRERYDRVKERINAHPTDEPDLFRSMPPLAPHYLFTIMELTE